MAKRTTPRTEADETATESQPPPAPASKTRPRKRARASRTDATKSQNQQRTESRRSAPSEGDIRVRAYYRYLERGGVHGLDFDDWVAAELELTQNRRGS